MPRCFALAVALLFAPPSASPRPSPTPTQTPTVIFTQVTPVLWVTDVRRSATFYRETLGFLVRDYTVGCAITVNTLGDSDVPYAATLLVGPHKIGLLQAERVHPEGVLLNVRVNGIDALHSRVVASGAPIRKFVPIVQGGIMAFSVLDPDGHEILFLKAHD